MNCKGFEPQEIAEHPPYPLENAFNLCALSYGRRCLLSASGNYPYRMHLAMRGYMLGSQAIRNPLAHQSPYSNNCPFSCYQILLGVLNVLHGKRTSFTDNPCVDVPYLQYRQCNTGFLLSFGKENQKRNPAKGQGLLQGTISYQLWLKF